MLADITPGDQENAPLDLLRALREKDEGSHALRRSLEAERQRRRAEGAEALAEKQALQERAAAVEGDLRRQFEALQGEHERRAEEHTAQVARLAEQLEAARAKEAELLEKNGDLAADLRSLLSRAEVDSANVIALRAKVEALGAEVGDSQSLLRISDEVREGLLRDAKDQRDQLEQARKELRELHSIERQGREHSSAQYDRLSAQCEALNRQLQERGREADVLEERCKRLEDALRAKGEEAERSLQAADDRCRAAEVKITKAGEDAEVLRGELRARVAGEAKLRESIVGLESQIQDHKGEEQRLRQEMFRLQALADEREMHVQTGKKREQQQAEQIASLEGRLEGCLAESASRQEALYATRAQVQTLELELHGAREGVTAARLLASRSKEVDQEAHQDVLKRKKDKIAQLEADVAALEASAARLQDELREKKDEAVRRDEDLRAKGAEIMRKDGELRQRSETLEQKDLELRTHSEGARQKEGDLQRARSELDALRSDRDALQSQHENLRSEHHALRSEHRALRSEHEGVRSEHQGLRTAHEGLQSEHHGLRSEHQTLRAELQATLEASENRQQEAALHVERLQEELAQTLNEADIARAAAEAVLERPRATLVAEKETLTSPRLLPPDAAGAPPPEEDRWGAEIAALHRSVGGLQAMLGFVPPGALRPAASGRRSPESVVTWHPPEPADPSLAGTYEDEGEEPGLTPSSGARPSPRDAHRFAAEHGRCYDDDGDSDSFAPAPAPAPQQRGPDCGRMAIRLWSERRVDALYRRTMLFDVWQLWAAIVKTADLRARIELALADELRTATECRAREAGVQGALAARLPEATAATLKRLALEFRHRLAASFLDLLPANLAEAQVLMAELLDRLRRSCGRILHATLFLYQKLRTLVPSELLEVLAEPTSRILPIPFYVLPYKAQQALRQGAAAIVRGASGQDAAAAVAAPGRRAATADQPPLPSDVRHPADPRLVAWLEARVAELEEALPLHGSSPTEVPFFIAHLLRIRTQAIRAVGETPPVELTAADAALHDRLDILLADALTVYMSSWRLVAEEPSRGPSLGPGPGRRPSVDNAAGNVELRLGPRHLS